MNDLPEIHVAILLAAHAAMFAAMAAASAVVHFTCRLRPPTGPTYGRKG